MEKNVKKYLSINLCVSINYNLAQGNFISKLILVIKLFKKSASSYFWVIRKILVNVYFFH